MDRGTYAASSNGLANLLKLQVVSNNLANISTPGFKRELVVGSRQSFDETLAASQQESGPFDKGDHDRVSNVVSLKTITDFSPGPIEQTGNALDVALREASDFFVIDTPQGPAYTRAGNFTLDQTGQVVTADGMAVQGDGGAITVPEGGQLRISENGQVFVGTEAVGKLQVVRFDDTSNLVRMEGSRFKQDGGAAPQAVEPSVIPNSIEKANVSTVVSIVELMTVQRGFESYVKTAQSIDELNRTAINDLARG